MRRIILIFLLLNISCAPRIIVKKPLLYQDAWEEKKIEIPSSKLEDFSGEKYSYLVKWFGLTVGKLEFQNLGIQEYKGISCYHILIKARTNRLLKYLFKVEDEFHSYIRAEDLTPIAFISDRKERRYRSKSEMYFDYENQKLIYHSFLDNSIKEVKLKKGVLDPVSCFYKFRTLDLKYLNYTFPIIQRAKLWQLKITVVRKGMLEMRKRGVFKAFLINIKAHSGKEKAKGEAWIWFSADKKKVPLLGQINVDIPIVGTVVGVLE